VNEIIVIPLCNNNRID